MALDNQALQAILNALPGHPDANNTTAGGAEATNSNAAAERLLAGKYKTSEELERGYTNQMTETQRIIAENNTLKQKLEMAESFISDARMGADRSMPNDRVTARKPALDTLAESLNVDRDLLAGAMAEMAGRAVAPITSGIAARQIVSRENPDFSNHEAKVAQYLEANPQLNARLGNAIRAATGDPETLALLLDYSYLKYDRANANTTTTPRNDTSGTDLAQAKIDATIPGAGASRATSSEMMEVQKVADAFRKGQETDDWTEYLNLRLTGIIPESHYNPSRG